MERTWTGRIRPGAQVEHERFVAWLSSQDGQSLLARTLLSSYRLSEENGRITVRFSADEPPPIIRFLRYPRFWPEFWEFESADPMQTVSPLAHDVVAWHK